MSQNHEKSETTTIKQKLSLLIHKNSKILLGLLTIIVVSVVGLLIYNSIQIKNLEKYTREIEIIQDSYSELTIITDEIEKEEAVDKILLQIETLISNSPKNYALQRALFIKGNLYFQNQDWDKAAEAFSLVASDFQNSYLAPISLINKAIVLEESNKIDEAIETYQSVIKKYSSVSPDIPNSYFSLGRLYEQKQDTDAALVEYNNLVDSFPGSNWTNLARSRIIYIESK